MRRRRESGAIETSAGFQAEYLFESNWKSRTPPEDLKSAAASIDLLIVPVVPHGQAGAPRELRHIKSLDRLFQSTSSSPQARSDRATSDDSSNLYTHHPRDRVVHLR